MVEQLAQQLRMLEECMRKAFDEGRAEYLPQIATKLRILVVRSRQNAPLLFEIAVRLGDVPKVTLGGPPLPRRDDRPGPGDTMTLDAFFDLSAVTIQTSAGPVTMTKQELIRAWCEQLGGVHEDWSVDEALVNAIRTPIFFGGMQPSAMELRNSARLVLRHGQRLVELGRRSESGG